MVEQGEHYVALVELSEDGQLGAELEGDIPFRNQNHIQAVEIYDGRHSVVNR